MELATSFTKDLPRKLGAEEVTERSGMLARITEEIAEVEAEAKKIASQFGQKIKGLRLQQITLAHAVNTHEENAPVLCSERADLRRFQIVTYRHDTSESVDMRAMTKDEVEEARQSNLFPNVRVSTEPKKGGPDVSTPPATTAEKLAGAMAGNAPPADDDGQPAITDPGAVLEGNVPAAEPSKTSKKRRTGRGGLHIVEDEKTAEALKDASPEVAKLAAEQAADAKGEPAGEGEAPADGS